MDPSVQDKFDEYDRKLDKLTKAIENLTVNGQSVPKLSADGGQGSASQVGDIKVVPPPLAWGHSASNDSISTSYDIVQHEFKKLSESYNKTHLPPEVKLHVERTGFRGEESRKLNIVSSCAKYSELILKLVADAPEDSPHL